MALAWSPTHLTQQSHRTQGKTLSFFQAGSAGSVAGFYFVSMIGGVRVDDGLFL